jgi:hypothetical protein
MPRDGAIILTDLQAPFLHFCEPCGRVDATPWPGSSPNAATQS